MRVLNVTEPIRGFIGQEVAGNTVYASRTDASSNIMLSAWGAFIISVLLCTSWFKAFAIVTDWVFLGAFSLALMLSSYFYYKKEVPLEDEDGSIIEVTRCEAYQRESCDRVLFGMYFGLASGIFSLVMMFLGRVSIITHIVVSTVLVIGWIIAVSLISYGSGHGSHAGDVYVEVWACVFLSMDLVTTSIESRDSASDDSKDAATEDSIKAKIEAPMNGNEHCNNDQMDQMGVSEDHRSEVSGEEESITMSA